MPQWIDAGAAGFAGLLFWLLLPAVLAAPMRWAVLAWLLMTNLDATGSGQASNLNLGWINGVKAVLLPGWLVFRLRRVPGESAGTFGAKAWLVLAVYAATATLWSPFPLAGIKLAAGMAAIMLALAALEKAARTGSLDRTVMLGFLAGSLVLALVNALFFADGSFGFAGRGLPPRFTSFVAAQQYAALLAALVCWLLWAPGDWPRLRPALVLLVFAALAANGSRTWSLGTLVALGIYTWTTRRRLQGYILLAAAVAVLAAVPSIKRGAIRPGASDPANRLTATASAILTGQDTPRGTGLGTMRFRLTLYRGVLDELRNSEPWRLLAGHGTAGGGRIALRLFPQAYRPESLDANRVMHDEWLRAAYEWGAVGLGLFLAALAGLAWFAVQAWREEPEPGPGRALAAYLPALLLGMTTENVIDGAGNAVTAGFLVLAASSFAARGRYAEERDHSIAMEPGEQQAS